MVFSGGVVCVTGRNMTKGDAEYRWSWKLKLAAIVAVGGLSAWLLITVYRQSEALDDGVSEHVLLMNLCSIVFYYTGVAVAGFLLWLIAIKVPCAAWPSWVRQRKEVVSESKDC